MQSLNFNDGLIRLAINGDENRIITINPTDFGLLSRYKEVEPKINALAQTYENTSEIGDEESIKILSELDKKTREFIDYIVGSPVSEIVFGNANCLSVTGGSPIYENFLNAYISYLEPIIKEEVKKSKSRIEKYTKQVK